MDEETVRLYKERGAFLCTTISPALPYALFDTAVSGASEKDQYNGKIVFDGVVESAKTALANGIPVGLGNDVAAPTSPSMISGGSCATSTNTAV